MVAKIGQKCYHYYLKLKSAVEVVLPVKQGLKQGFPTTKTPRWSIVEVVLPVKQGLKPIMLLMFDLPSSIVEVVLPVKQGLKHLR